MRKHLIRIFALIGALLLAATVGWAQAPRAEITFDNQSGQPTLVKLIGPARRAVEVPNASTRTVRASGGQYFILARYGSDPGHYTYSKGDPFTVVQTRRRYSVIRITLHTVVNGNYHTTPISASDFEREIP